MQTSCIPALTLDTAGLPSAAAFALWAEAMTGYDVSRLDQGSEFAALAEAWMVGPLVVSRSRLAPVMIARTRDHILRDPIDHYSLVLPLEGEWHTRLEDRDFTSLPGVVSIFDNSRPYVSTTTRLDVIVVMMPRHEIEAAYGAGDLHGRRLALPSGRLLADHLALLVDHLPRLTEVEAPFVAQATSAMVAACLRAAIRPSSSAGSATFARRAARLVESDLGPALTPERLRTTLNVSRATLYRLFRPVGGVAGFIRERRLVRVHARVSANDERSVKRLAADFGFASGTQLTRAFRARFGYTITDLRVRARSATSFQATSATTGQFRGWVDLLNAPGVSPQPKSRV